MTYYTFVVQFEADDIEQAQDMLDDLHPLGYDYVREED